jgi:mannose-6-phosphate isomerase-like protein (cupin superfamily)
MPNSTMPKRRKLYKLNFGQPRSTSSKSSLVKESPSETAKEILMSDATTLMRPAEGMKLAISSAKEAHYGPGRRHFFQYRDLGVTEATNGKMRAQVTSAKSAMDRATGWHYHTCDMQFVYILKGWVDLEFAGGRKQRFGVGDSVMIPGGLAHQEIATSDDLELVEVSVPAEMGTEPCGPA